MLVHKNIIGDATGSVREYKKVIYLCKIRFILELLLDITCYDGLMSLYNSFSLFETAPTVDFGTFKIKNIVVPNHKVTKKIKHLP